MSERLLKVSELAERLSIGRWAAYQLLADGVLPVVNLGGRTVRVRETDLESYIRQGGSKTRPRVASGAR